MPTIKALTTAAAAIIGLIAVLSGISLFAPDLNDPPPPPPVITTYEGEVSRLVVEDPHNGGWHGDKSRPQAVTITVAGQTFDLDGDLKQAAAVQLGQTVVIRCGKQPDRPRRCTFDGVVQELPTTPTRKATP